MRLRAAARCAADPPPVLMCRTPLSGHTLRHTSHPRNVLVEGVVKERERVDRDEDGDRPNFWRPVRLGGPRPVKAQLAAVK